jgi:hypothetical protein
MSNLQKATLGESVAFVNVETTIHNKADPGMGEVNIVLIVELKAFL